MPAFTEPSSVRLNVFDHNEHFPAGYVCFLLKLYLNSIRRERNGRAARHPADITVMCQVTVGRQKTLKE